MVVARRARNLLTTTSAGPSMAGGLEMVIARIDRNRLATVALAALCIAPLGCASHNRAERAGRHVDRTIDKVDRETDRAAEKTEEAAERGADKVDRAVEELKK
jgi:hypothetical protein